MHRHMHTTFSEYPAGKDVAFIFLFTLNMPCDAGSRSTEHLLTSTSFCCCGTGLHLVRALNSTVACICPAAGPECCVCGWQRQFRNICALLGHNIAVKKPDLVANEMLCWTDVSRDKSNDFLLMPGLS